MVTRDGLRAAVSGKRSCWEAYFTLLELQSRFGDTPVKFQVVLSQIVPKTRLQS